MSNLSLCVGKYAKTPYLLERTNTTVSSIEELCYVMKENLFLLDSRNMNRKLADFIDLELGLWDLSKNLYGLLNGNSSVSAYVTTILEYVGYLEPAQIKEIESLLKENANLNEFEKRKVRADYEMKNQRYMTAVREYLEILNLIDESDYVLQSKMLHNLGVAYACMFLFEEAGEYFHLSYQKHHQEESLIQYLACIRMFKSEEEYISFLSEKPEYFESSLRLEKDMAAVMTQWKATKSKYLLEELLELKEHGNVSAYYQKAEETLAHLKEMYRESVVV